VARGGDSRSRSSRRRSLQGAGIKLDSSGAGAPWALGCGFLAGGAATQAAIQPKLPGHCCRVIKV